MNAYVSLLLGVVCAGVGGELFVRGTVGIGRLARISPGIIGATLAAFATSSPEASVAINSALAGTPELALGDALGSNVVNLALILGFALAMSGIQCPRDSIKRDFPIALLVPVITSLLLLDGTLSRLDGFLMLCLFSAWLFAAVVHAQRHRGDSGHAPDRGSASMSILSGIAGLALLIAAGKLIVAGATEIAYSFGIDEFVVGATLVAFGTSTPEFATTVIAKLRGHDEVGLGTILGSNIFNGAFIVAIAAVIHPISVPKSEAAVALAFGLVALALSFPGSSGFLNRRRGALLLLAYGVYLTAIIHRR